MKSYMGWDCNSELMGYRQKCIEAKGTECVVCGSDEGDDIVIHHVDGIRFHNELENLEPMCESCHRKVHEGADGYEDWSEQLMEHPDNTTTIRITKASYHELQKRAEDVGAETFQEIIDHLLKETTEEISLDEAIERGLDEYGGLENVPAIYAEHPGSINGNSPSFLELTFHTAEAETLRDWIDEVDSHHRVVIETDTGEIRLPIRMMGTMDGPKDWDHAEGTPLYTAESVHGAEPIDLDDGVENLKRKLRENASEADAQPNHD